MAEIPNKPITRKETYLAAIAGQNVDLPPYPITREEAYLDEIAKNGGGGGGTSNYNQLTNKPQINNVELSGNKTSSQLGLMASDGVVANPTGQTTGTLTALEVGGTKYAVPSGGTSDYTALTNKPSINGVELSGNKTASQLGMANSNTFQGTIAEWNQLSTEEKKAYDHASIPDSIDGGVTFPADKVIMTGGGNVEDAIDNVYTATNGTGVNGAFHYTKIGRIVIGAGEMRITQNIAAYSAIVTDLPLSETTVMGAFVAQDNGYNTVYINTGSIASNILTRIARNNGELVRLSCVYLARN